MGGEACSGLRQWQHHRQRRQGIADRAVRGLADPAPERATGLRHRLVGCRQLVLLAAGFHACRQQQGLTAVTAAAHRDGGGFDLGLHDDPLFRRQHALPLGPPQRQPVERNGLADVACGGSVLCRSHRRLGIGLMTACLTFAGTRKGLLQRQAELRHALAVQAAGVIAVGRQAADRGHHLRVR